jgi:1-pyrroline-4-hydroxy-2-carboxylate deaminase
LAHYTAVANASDRPIIIYNNPIAYKVDITPVMLETLAKEEKFVAIKESSGDTRRITDLFNQVGDRFTVFAGVDDLIMECVMLGATGWIAGIGLAVPEENQLIWNLMMSGKWEEAREVYRWYTPLMHLDVGNKFVQCIKLAIQEAGLGSEWVRAPRLELVGDERAKVMQVIETALNNRPK